MRLTTVCLSITILLLAAAASAQAAAPMKSTAPEKMMPAAKAKKMRACDKLAMEQKIKMADRTSFVADCMAKMK